MDHYIDDSYDTINGLRLTGEIRPWLDIDGSIYSRYDFILAFWRPINF